jgi:hypothetical protein
VDDGPPVLRPVALGELPWCGLHDVAENYPDPAVASRAVSLLDGGGAVGEAPPMIMYPLFEMPH